MICRVRVIREGLTPSKNRLLYRSGKIPAERLRDGCYVVIDILGRRELGQVIEVARTRKGLSGRHNYTGKLKTIERLANPAELKIVADIIRAEVAQERAQARRTNKHRALRTLLNR